MQTSTAPATTTQIRFRDTPLAAAPSTAPASPSSTAYPIHHPARSDGGAVLME